MLHVRRSADRGHFQHGWLDTFHTFSFAGYYDPDWMGFGALRVINEDTIAAKRGFDEHSHEDMEILTYVIEGALEHRDNLGNGSVIHPNQIQYMSAGTGIQHSEFNPADEPVHLLQIWIEPNMEHAEPRYEEKELPGTKPGELQLIASADGRDGSVAIRQAADVYLAKFMAGDSAIFHIVLGRKQWIQVISGELGVGPELLKGGDACEIESEGDFALHANQPSHFLLFDLAS
ncbi:MAG: pirin family protein [Patescibacteria group bacterium]